MSEEERAAFMRYLDARHELTRFECKMAMIQGVFIGMTVFGVLGLVLVKTLH